MRLAYPHALDAEMREVYFEYLRSHTVDAGKRAICDSDMTELLYVLDNLSLTPGGMSKLVEYALELKNTEAVSVLLERKNRMGKRKTEYNS